MLDLNTSFFNPKDNDSYERALMINAYSYFGAAIFFMCCCVFAWMWLEKHVPQCVFNPKK